MWKILAISGGVDSACLLHFYRHDPEIIVAHFNHGTRPSAADDEKFVQALAASYRKKCIVGRGHLGENASEEKARQARYDFLERVSAQYDHAPIYTAHHLDDLTETIAINFLRGTGWRGLAPFSRANLRRPFLDSEAPQTKTDLLRYAAENQLTFREDPTNHEDNYLRNRIREILKPLPRADKIKLAELYHRQTALRADIETELKSLLPNDGVYQRAWFKDDKIALEFLRTALLEKSLRATRPQLEDFLSAIKNYAPEKSFNLPEDRLVKLHKNYFVL